MCRVYCTAKKIRGKAQGTNTRLIEENPEVVSPAEGITDTLYHGETDTHLLPIDSRYPIPIPYELCTLTK
jgi:hypothetical protein